jgi:hypothetical protein
LQLSYDSLKEKRAITNSTTVMIFMVIKLTSTVEIDQRGTVRSAGKQSLGNTKDTPTRHNMLSKILFYMLMTNLVGMALCVIIVWACDTSHAVIGSVQVNYKKLILKLGIFFALFDLAFVAGLILLIGILELLT